LVILADTSAWIEFLRGRGTPAHLELRTRLRSGDVAFTDPVQMEILAGARNRNQLIELSRLFFSLAYLPVAGRDDWDDAASMYRAARRAGFTVRSQLDCLIAAVAVRTGTPVLHHDADFARLAAVADVPLADGSLSSG
jgi:predicted nucleic acid-binding protein